MSTPPNSGKSSCKILYVDDELLSLKYFEQIVGEDFEVITAPSAEEGLRIVERHSQSIAVVVSDQRLRGLQGTTFLTQLREKSRQLRFARSSTVGFFSGRRSMT